VKILIIYFSLTGSTKKIAQAIFTGIRSQGEECHIVKLKEANCDELAGYDLIGLGSPVHFYEPANVTNFIKRLPNLAGKHTFLFYTHATRPEAFLPSIMEALQPKDMCIIGAGHWYGSFNDQQFPKPYLTDGHPDEIDLQEAEEFGREMVNRSRRIHLGERNLIPILPMGREMGMKMALEVQKIATNNLQAPETLNFKHGDKQQPRFKTQAKFNVQKCEYPKCRLCVDNCPMGGIDLSASPPKFAEPCMNCFFCEKICPTGAIEADFEAAAQIFCWRTKHILAPVLAKAEAEGRFRRLIPLDKVGWDTPYYKVYSQHPRYIIPED
jgi:flavodoxin/NAD-dependent dihydropyrimidine dehydrogenase PreA subunit